MAYRPINLYSKIQTTNKSTRLARIEDNKKSKK